VKSPGKNSTELKIISETKNNVTNPKNRR